MFQQLCSRHHFTLRQNYHAWIWNASIKFHHAFAVPSSYSSIPFPVNSRFKWVHTYLVPIHTYWWQLCFAITLKKSGLVQLNYTAYTVSQACILGVRDLIDYGFNRLSSTNRVDNGKGKSPINKLHKCDCDVTDIYCKCKIGVKGCFFASKWTGANAT